MRSAQTLQRARTALRMFGSARRVRALLALAQLLRPVAQSASTVFCASNIWLGVALGAALGLLPQYLLAAVAGTLMAHALARMVSLPEVLLADGSLTYNAMLAALAVAWITREAGLAPWTFVALLAATIAVTLALSAALLHFLPRVVGLPPLSLAFVLVFGSLLTLFPAWSAASMQALFELPGLPDGVPQLLAGFLTSLGTVLFMPHPFAGLSVAIALLAWSRLALLFAAAGYVAGMAVVWSLGQLGVPYHGAAAAHNYLLAGLALGAVYFVPSRASLALAAAAGAGAALAAAVLQRLLQGSGWEYLPLPFILTVWAALSALRLRVDTGALAPAVHAAPNAEALWRGHARDTARFPAAGEAHLLLPAAGVLTVTQGFAGKLSHRGPWQHALDFELRDAAGLAHARGAGARLEDFHTFGLPVGAPDAGTVLRVVDDVNDNAPGICNFARSWGNHVVLRLDGGAQVTLAHFRHKGIHVVPGQRVAAGQLLGECGNSGRSPVPHIHLQVQAGPHPGAPTLPFRIANYLQHDADGARWMAAGVPPEGARVSAALAHPALLGCLARMAPGRSVFQVRSANGSPGVEVVDCALDEAGRHVFTAGRGRLVGLAGINAWNVLECDSANSRVLWLFGLGLPRAPYASAPAMWWQDRVDWHLPGATWLARLHAAVAGFIGPFAGWRGLRTVSRYVGAVDSGVVRVHTVLEAGFAPAGVLPDSIEVALEPVRGVTALAAHGGGHDIDIRLVSFEPAAF